MNCKKTIVNIEASLNVQHFKTYELKKKKRKRKKKKKKHEHKGSFQCP